MIRFGMAALATAGAIASADIHTWSWAPGDGGAGYSDSGGAFESVWGRYDASASRLTWEVAFANQITDGFTLALGDGASPKGTSGAFAFMYFDATDVSNVRVSAYGYNGMSTQSSYRDGSSISGTQAPDLIFGVSPTLGNAPSILEASVSDSGNGRRMRLVLDASLINAHTPAYPRGEGGWHGIGFGSELGVWLSPLTSLATDYNADGSLRFWSGRQGWLDGANLAAQVPAPGFAAIGLVTAGFAGGRRRR